MTPAAGGRRSDPPAARLLRYDRALGARWVIGADEAGRGCLAGPLVAAAVCIDYRSFSAADARALRAVDDSKRVPASARGGLAQAILARATQVAVIVSGAATIDRVGLHVTNLASLSKALAAIDAPEALCLVDGFALGEGARPHRRLVGGDRTSFAVAAASVVAKETRDRLMRGPVAGAHPDHGFEQHVGYATALHREAIRRHGTTPYHRRSFRSTAYGEGAGTALTTQAPAPYGARSSGGRGE